MASTPDLAEFSVTASFRFLWHTIHRSLRSVKLHSQHSNDLMMAFMSRFYRPRRLLTHVMHRRQIRPMPALPFHLLCMLAEYAHAAVTLAYGQDFPYVPKKPSHEGLITTREGLFHRPDHGFDEYSGVGLMPSLVRAHVPSPMSMGFF
jgi:hypothetical protein